MDDFLSDKKCFENKIYVSQKISCSDEPYTHIHCHTNGKIKSSKIYFNRTRKLHVKANYDEENNLTGKYNLYYTNGLINSVFNYFKGKKNGSFVSYYDNGKIHVTGIYKNDLIESVTELYDETGRDCLLHEGEITVWKLCKAENKIVYVELLVPNSAQRITDFDECLSIDTIDEKIISRVNCAQVIKIFDDANNEYDNAFSLDLKNNLTFEVGKQVNVNINLNMSNDIFKNNDELNNGIDVKMYLDQWIELKNHLEKK